MLILKSKLFLFYMILVKVFSKNILDKRIDDVICSTGSYEKPKNGELFELFCQNSWREESAFYLIDPEKDILIQKTLLPDYFLYHKKLKNGFNLYIEEHSSIIIKNVNYNYVIDMLFEARYYNCMVSNNDSTILFYTHPDVDNLSPFLLIFKYPYSSIYKNVSIEFLCAKITSFNIIALKDFFFTLLFFKQEKTLMFRIYNLDMDSINTKNLTFQEEIVEVKASKISDVEYYNEFIVCILFISNSFCKLYKIEKYDFIFMNEVEVCSKLKNNYSTSFLDLYTFEENNLDKFLIACEKHSDYERSTKDIITFLNYRDGIVKIDEKYQEIDASDTIHYLYFPH